MSAIGLKYPGRSGSDTVRGLIAGGIRLLATAFTKIGTSIITARILQTATAAKNMGWGTGTNAAAITDTALQSEVAPTTAGGRTVGTESRTTVTETNDNYQIAGAITQNQTGPVAITEAGCFDAVSTGNMLLRTVFAAINTYSGDAIAFTFGLKFATNVA